MTQDTTFYADLMARLPDKWWLNIPKPKEPTEIVYEPTPIALTEKENDTFARQLLKDIPFFHRLYAKYKDPKWLELAQSVADWYEEIKNTHGTHI